MLESSVEALPTRHFHFYKLADGRFCGSISCSHSPGVEQVISANMTAGEGFIEHTGAGRLRLG